VTGTARAEGFHTEILTRLQLVLDALLYSGAVRAIDATAARVYAGAEMREGAALADLQGRWPGLTSDQLLGVTGLGRALAPQEYQSERANAGDADGRCSELLPATFQRRRELPRNAPSVINSGFSDRLFHDGRADSVFNGYDHLGDDAGLDGYGKWVVRQGRWCRVLVRLPDAALASQAVVPLLSASEMSWFGRQYHHVARKLLDRVPLLQQQVAATDSHLGPLVRQGRLTVTYRQLIQRAFCEEWWCGGQVP
ncbi:MAG: cytochrome c peroxidase, partial [Planctomycetaceae bacterium]